MKLIPRLKPYLGWKELFEMLKPSRGNISRFESEFAQKFNCKGGVMFSHGRSAMYALFRAWDLSGDEIICPAYTCVVVQHSIVLSGNVPVFVDCEPGSPNMSYEGIAEAITENTRAIVVTHLFGYPMDVHRVQNIVKEAEERYGHKIFVMQDAAHSYGAKWKGELVTGFGDAAIFGMNVSKIMTSVFGGMATSKDQETLSKLRAYRDKHFKQKGLFAKISKSRLSSGYKDWVQQLGLWFHELDGAEGTP